MANSDKQLNNKGDKRGIHPNSLKNLEIAREKGFKKGKSGNPNGQSLTALVKLLLKEVPEISIGGKRNTKTWRQLIAQAWLVGSYQGNATLFKELLERIEGKVALPITGKDGEPLMSPPIVRFHFADGMVIEPPSDGHRPVGVEADGNGHKTAGN